MKILKPVAQSTTEALVSAVKATNTAVKVGHDITATLRQYSSTILQEAVRDNILAEQDILKDCDISKDEFESRLAAAYN